MAGQPVSHHVQKVVKRVAANLQTDLTWK